MKRVFFLVGLAVIFLASCSPSQQELAQETNIVEASATNMWTDTPTLPPTLTSTQTPTTTPTPTLTPTITPTPTPTQIAGGNGKVLLSCFRSDNIFFDTLWIYDLSRDTFEKVFPDRSRNRQLWFSEGARSTSPNGQLIAWDEFYARNVNISKTSFNASIVVYNHYISDSSFGNKVETPLYIAGWITDELILYHHFSSNVFGESQIYLGNIDGSYLEYIGTVPLVAARSSPNGNYVLVGYNDNNEILVLDVEGKRIIRTYEVGTYTNIYIKDPWVDDTHFYYNERGTGDYYLFDVEKNSKELLGSLLWMSPDGDHFADKTNTIRSLSGDAEIFLGQREEVGMPISWSPDGERLILNNWEDKEIHVFDMATKEFMSKIPYAGSVGQEIKWSLDGQWFITGAQKQIGIGIYHDYQICNYQSCQPILPPGADVCSDVLWIADPQPEYEVVSTELPGYLKALKYLNSERAYILDDYLIVDNRDSGSDFDYVRTTLEFESSFSVSIRMDGVSNNNGFITISGGRPKIYGQPWQGYTRMAITQYLNSAFITITDGLTEDGIFKIELDVPKDESFQIVFNDIQGKTFSILNHNGEVLGEYNFVEIDSLDMPKGLFPNELVYLGTKVNAKSSFRIYDFAIVED